MKNYQECWAKTLLDVNCNLDAICGAIDKNINNCCVSSSRSQMSTIYFADKIIRLMQRKKFMINIRVLINTVFKNLPLESAKILTVKYIDKMKTDTACKLLEMPNRTYFRKIKKAVQDFAFELKKQGYDELKLYEMFKDELWILETFDNHLKKNAKDIEKINLVKLALSSISKQSYSVCQI